MGDHRAYIKIEMEFHGIKNKTEMDINYFPGMHGNIDDRITEFIEDIYERGIEKYEEKERKWEEDRNKDRIEKEEKKELKRLKKKYESN